MTDLATQPQADEASPDDAVETEQAVETEPSTETETEADATTDVEAETEADAATDVEAETEADAATDVETETEADAAEDAEALGEPAEGTVAGTEDAEQVEDADASSDAAEEAEAEAEAEPEAEAEAETGAEEPEADAEATEAEDESDEPGTEEPEADAEATEAEDEAEAEAEAEPGAEEREADAEATEAEDESDADADEPEAADPTELETIAVATAVLSPEATTPLPPLPTVSAAAAAAGPATATAAGPATATATAPSDASPVFAWAPAGPAAKKKHTAIWISAAAGAAVIGLVVSSLVLIAPGTTVAGVPVGWLTPGAAEDAITQTLADTTVVVTGEGGDVELTGAELGASVDAQSLADAAFAEHPMWNVTTWFQSTDAEVELDAATATEALREALPELYTDPVDATLAFDPASASYVTTAAVPGAGIDLATVQAALQDALVSGSRSVDVAPVPAEIPASISTETADATAAQLNGILDTAGFYVGEERTVPIDRAVAASWITLDEGDDGTIVIDVDQQKIQSVVDTLPGLVNRDAVNATVVTNSAGKVLANPVSAGVEGRSLESTDGIAAAFADQLAAGDGVYELSVTSTPFTTTNLARRIDVNLTTQRATLFENDQVVQTFVMSSGAAGTPTPTGNFTVYAYTRITDMGALCYNPNAVNSYCTEDVPWVTWFYPDIAFHGANSFRSALGFPQSHGCVNMWDDAAKFIYDWSRVGTEVSVHY